MTTPHVTVALVVVAVLPTAIACAQQADLGIPKGWVTSPKNEKAEGEAGYRILHEETGIELLYVPAGTFMMGAADDGPRARDNEKPQHEHRVRAFWIGCTEVTAQQWRRVMGSDPEGYYGDDHPAVSIGWEEARGFCRRLGLVLPTEAQWEYAARGPQNHVYPWGDEWDENLCSNAATRVPGRWSFPVGSFREDASWCGALDMAGNVWEWCDDWYKADVYDRYSVGDFTPPGRSLNKVVRGGSFLDRSGFRCSRRAWYVRFSRGMCLGFRCALGR